LFSKTSVNKEITRIINFVSELKYKHFAKNKAEFGKMQKMKTFRKRKIWNNQKIFLREFCLQVSKILRILNIGS